MTRSRSELVTQHSHYTIPPFNIVYSTQDNHLFNKIRVSISFQECVHVHAQSCPALCNPVDCSLPGPSVHRIPQARIPEWVAISFSRGSSWPRDQTWILWFSCFGRQILYHLPLGKPLWDQLRKHLIYVPLTVANVNGWMTNDILNGILVQQWLKIWL